MKKILINVNYDDPTGKYWQDSYVKNVIAQQEEGESINDTVIRIIEQIDNVEFSYKGKPQSNMFRDNKSGESKHIGYIYRIKSELYDRSQDVSGEKMLFDAWVEIHEVIPADIKPLN